MTYYVIDRSHAWPRWSGELTTSARRWSLPGLRDCPGCGETWAGLLAYPNVDLAPHTELAAQLQATGGPEDWATYSHLRDQVRAVCPPGTCLMPGTEFGPLLGAASGTWGPATLVMPPWGVLLREDALAAVQARGLRGITPVRTELVGGEQLVELALPLAGALHPDSIPGPRRQCAVCEREDWTLPEDYWLDESSLPAADAFRVADAPTLVIVTEAFRRAVGALGHSDIDYRRIDALPPRREAHHLH
ncbi:double-CXXCG motif protein [Myxococcus stipitatus]|uniref:SitI6 family double-CXXCG motif immunity protein n=1 Tax=Myxococcus stipitatus TaxID=83455 RepID=UPI001F3EE837|nr:double-CXXCG motif protein [Myxococcus stipitatus]MCE9674095.1 double-CXXCG motif protein [Myxococcus stipitatus]